MQPLLENTQISLFPSAAEAPVNKQSEDWKKSIPAQVFLNHFFAVSYHITQSNKAYALHLNPHFGQHKPQLNAQDVGQIGKHLLNAWSTEYALRATGSLGDETYLRNALHWTFPQAYYSAFAGLQAFLRTLGITDSNEELVRRAVGRLVVKGYYPEPIGFYAAGHYNAFSVHRLPLAKFKPGLQLASQAQEAQAQIGQFLRTTRRLRALSVRQAVQANSATAVRSVRTGEVLQKFSQTHWNQLTWRYGCTSYFDLLGRLRVSANHREIRRFVEAEIDFRLFHQSLLALVEYLNCIHEAYVAKALGLDKYRKFVAGLPAHLRDGFVKKRLVEKIEPMLTLAPSGEPATVLSQSA